MSWHRKKSGGSGRRYLYLWNRDTRRKDYVGRGAVARREERRLAAWKSAELRQRTVWELTAARIDGASTPIDRLCRLGGMLLRVVLVAAGLHQHARSQWRRRSETNG